MFSVMLLSECPIIPATENPNEAVEQAELIDRSPFPRCLDVAYGFEASGTSSTSSGVHVVYSSLARLGTVIDFYDQSINDTRGTQMLQFYVHNACREVTGPEV